MFEDAMYPDVLMMSEGAVMPLEFKMDSEGQDEESIENAAIRLSNQVWDYTQAEITEVTCKDIT